MENRLYGVMKKVDSIPLDSGSKIVIISDCHRGNGSGADDFAKNQNLYYTALRHYEQNGFTYIELGDGDDLWKNKCFEDIAREYENTFSLLTKLHVKGRLHMIFGNHDIIKSREKWAQKHLAPIFPGIKIKEGLLLHDRASGGKILLVHGHQADFFNDRLWPLSKFLVRHVWQPLELVGVTDPTRASIKGSRRDSVERRLASFAEKEGLMLIAGHTHRAVFTGDGSSLYFNDGSCVHPRYITALEIENGAISLVRWNVSTSANRFLFVSRELVEKPAPLEAIFASAI